MSDKKSKIVLVVNVLIVFALLVMSFCYKNFFNNKFEYNFFLLLYYNLGVFIAVYIYYKFINKLRERLLKYLYLITFTIFNIYLFVWVMSQIRA